MADREIAQGPDGERKSIESVPLSQGPNSVPASLTSVLQAAGADVECAYPMEVSGRAFRLQFAWCPSTPHSYIGFSTFGPALEP
jgi:hypothetical protein